MASSIHPNLDISFPTRICLTEAYASDVYAAPHRAREFFKRPVKSRYIEKSRELNHPGVYLDIILGSEQTENDPELRF